MIDSGRDSYSVDNLSSLADFRDLLRDERNLPENRVQGRNRRGRILVQRDGSVGVGSYTIDYRKKLLTRLIELQERVGDTLITDEEVSRIYQIWAEEQADLALLLERKLEAGK